MNTTHFCVMTDPLDKNIKVSDLEVRNDPYVDDRDGDDKCYCSTKTYNKNSNKYYLIVPTDSRLNTTLNRDEKCGIDLGVRTFATIYSQNESIEVGTNLIPKIDLYNKKVDKLRSQLDYNFLNRIGAR